VKNEIGKTEIIEKLEKIRKKIEKIGIKSNKLVNNRINWEKIEKNGGK